MCSRIEVFHRILKSSGSLYLHCDGTSGHYLKLLLDNIFGFMNFRNEIIWHYKTFLRSSSHHLGRSHDLIYHYGKSSLHKIHPDRSDYPASASTVKRWSKVADSSGFVSNKHFSKKPSIIDTSDSSKGFYINRGIPCDVWSISAITGNSKEYTGYPTQKPISLLERIIKSSSNEGDVVLDPFCGSGSMCVAAQGLKRQWIGIDKEASAIQVASDRMGTFCGIK
jgi:site-specific DNA-methyltransferase (adenine-specific)